MDQVIQDTVNYNSAYISLPLLDELDYCFGGYGKPTPEFIFSLNTFVESFIGCSEFYTSLDELNHLNLTAPAIFPRGRPILNLVVRETGLKFVSGVLDIPGKVIYRGDLTGITKKEAEQAFISKHGKTLQADYFSISDVSASSDLFPLVTSKFENNELVVEEVQSSAFELVDNLIKVSNTSSIQTTLPVGLYGNQVNQLASVPYSIEALEKLAALHQVKLDDLLTSMNYQYMPVPPFTNILLSQLNSFTEIVPKLKQLRADFQELRDQFVLMEQQIYASPTIKEQLAARQEFNAFWMVFMKRYADQKHRLIYNRLDVFKDVELDKVFDKVVKSGDAKGALDELSVGKIAGKLIKYSLEWFSDRRVINRFKGLTNIWELFEDSTNINLQLKHFERLFGVQFSHVELNRVHDFIKNKITDLTRNIS